jgi:hypothetical protein
VAGFVNYKKGCIRLAAASDKAYQLFAHGQWFSPGTPASSTFHAVCLAEKQQIPILLFLVLSDRGSNSQIAL